MNEGRAFVFIDTVFFLFTIVGIAVVVTVIAVVAMCLVGFFFRMKTPKFQWNETFTVHGLPSRRLSVSKQSTIDISSSSGGYALSCVEVE